MKRLCAVLLLLIVQCAHAVDWQDSPAVSELFARAGVRGTFVVYDIGRNVLTGHDSERAHKRFVPASTFKIANSLIGLSTGAVTNVDEVLPFGGKPQPFKSWEKDMSLREAIKVSNVPIFQELARRIGLERMRTGIARIGYGNGDIGQVVDNFWLVGPLKISAVEQTLFLARLAANDVPFPAQATEQVREITLLERGPGWALHGKTGWANAEQSDLGWWVGWVQKGDRLFSFALNIDMPHAADASKRVDLGRAALKALGVL